MSLTNNDLIQMYRWMVLTRNFEETINNLAKRGMLPELQHSSAGQEAIGVGACYSLSREDIILPSLRTRAAFLVKGVPVRVLMAAMHGKYTKQAGGKQTSHHIGDLELGIIGGTGVIGGAIPVAVGIALGCKIRKLDRITVCFFGDGSTNEGSFHEAVNLAAVLRLPIIFICENNLYALSTPYHHAILTKNIADRASSYGIPGVIVDGNNVLDVYEAVQEAIQRAKAESPQPTLIECKTYRWHGHAVIDPPDRPYRTVEEINEWKQKCPIKRFREYLLGRSVLKEDMIAQIHNETQAEINEAIEFANKEPYPEPETVLEDVYAIDSKEALI